MVCAGYRYLPIGAGTDPVLFLINNNLLARLFPKREIKRQVVARVFLLLLVRLRLGGNGARLSACNDSNDLSQSTALPI